MDEAVVEYRSVYITVRDEPEARKLGQALVREKLAAYVNYFPVKSIYRWQENIEESGEIAIIAKTRTELAEPLIQRVKELHSYEVPCVVSWIIEKGNPDFIDWM
jgi:periplasmic divalent cation tolerance protein